MATLFYSPSIFSFSSNKFLLLPHRQQYYYQQLPKSNYDEDPRRKRFNFTLYACLKNDSSRSRRKGNSNEELCNDLREFLATVGLPEGHIPSMKLLSEHGRNDLAYKVRRRGYKLIKELLERPSTADVNGFTSKKGLTGQDQKVTDEVEDVLSSAEDPHVRNKSNLNSDDLVESSDSSASEEEDLFNLYSQNGNGNNLAEVVSLPTDVSVEEDHYCRPQTNMDLNSNDHLLLPIESSNFPQERKVSFGMSDNSISGFIESVNVEVHGDTTSDGSGAITLQEKAASFIQNGELDMIEDYDILNEIDAKESKEVLHGGDGMRIPSVHNASHQQHANDIKSDRLMTVNGSSIIMAPSATAYAHLRDTNLKAEEPKGAESDKDSNIETSRRENQDEINRLKFMLHQKELELSRLKDQIEKEKLALSDLQTKAETEINKAKQLISEKDAELQAAEESFSGLEEVQIQYSGDGEIVEVTGSFNGWHHQIKMDPQPSANILEHIGSRKSRLWSTVLWLYPGTYEIKFIVDGQWTVDPQRELVTRNGICNNILRVDR